MHTCVALLQPSKFKELKKPRGYPRRLESIGDHVRAARLDRGMDQKTAAQVIKVCPETLLTWEKNYFQPSLKHYPTIISFLEYVPPEMLCSEEASYGEKLIWRRSMAGYSQSEAAALIGIDPSTLAKYERDERHPSTDIRNKIELALDHLTSPIKNLDYSN